MQGLGLELREEPEHELELQLELEPGLEGNSVEQWGLLVERETSG